MGCLPCVLSGLVVVGLGVSVGFNGGLDVVVLWWYVIALLFYCYDCYCDGFTIDLVASWC